MCANIKNLIWHYMKLIWNNWLKLIWNNGWPLLFTFFIAGTLIHNLNLKTKWLGVPIDAALWPANSDAKYDAKPLWIVTQENKHDAQQQNEESNHIAETIKAKSLHSVLATTTALFIFLNTLRYLWEARKTRATGWTDFAWLLTVVCEVITLLWIIRLVHEWQPYSKFENEWIPFFIFIAFIIVDIICFFKTSIDEKAMKSFALYQVLLVDIPVILGIGISLTLAHTLHGQVIDSEHYFEAFFSGATVMHLAASQLIYAILSFIKDRELLLTSSATSHS